MHNKEKLTFGYNNAKLRAGIHTFSLPAGWTCPGALICRTTADPATGKITDGRGQQLRCWAASQEAFHPSVRKSRWRNLELLKKAKTFLPMVELILSSIPAKAQVVRVHVSGDFFNRTYAAAWMRAAAVLPRVRFYCYTKSAHLLEDLYIPPNFRVTYSIGGRHDDRIPVGAATCRIVYSEEEAAALGIEIDHDDSHAMAANDNYAVLLHGTQPAGTEAATALRRLHSAGKTGYSRS